MRVCRPSQSSCVQGSAMWSQSHVAMLPVFQVVDGEIRLVYQGLYLRELDSTLDSVRGVESVAIWS